MRLRWNKINLGRWCPWSPAAAQDYGEYFNYLYWSRYSWKKQSVKNALESGWLKPEEASAIEERMAKLKNSIRFRKDLEREQERYIWAFREFFRRSKRRNFRNDNSYITKVSVVNEWYHQQRKKLEDFFDKYRIDGVKQGEPYVDVFIVRTMLKQDNAGRWIAVFEVPLRFSRKSFQKHANKYLKRLAKCVDVQKWRLAGKQSEKRVAEFRSRNAWMINRFRELRLSGKKKIACYAQIAEEISVKTDWGGITDRSVSRLVRQLTRGR
jgi:hypothetical protein